MLAPPLFGTFVSTGLLFFSSSLFLLGELVPIAYTQNPPKVEPSQIRFTDITASSGVTFEHAISPEKKYLAESMSGGVLLLDYDQDGWLDIYFTNAQSVAMTLAGQKANGALYHNNHDGTFSDVRDKAGLQFPCSAMGGAAR